VAAGDLHDLAVRDLTEELVRRLQAFIAGRETHEALQAWGRAVWGESQEGPVGANRVATATLIDVWNAGSRLRPGDEGCPHVLRAVDAGEYVRMLQRGAVKAPVREVGELKRSLPSFVAQLGRETERCVLDGLGWYEFLQVASPGTGRVFVLGRPLEREYAHTEVAADVAGEETFDPQDILRDLFETLVVDLEDVLRLDEGFEAASRSLPGQTLWRQDDNGHRVEVARFTGSRKAVAALERLESSRHKQMYWLEDGPR
jgi:hypothetical protein